MVLLVEDKAAVRCKGEQALGGFEVLYFRMVELPGELPIFQQGCAANEKQQHQTKYADIP